MNKIVYSSFFPKLYLKSVLIHTSNVKTHTSTLQGVSCGGFYVRVEKPSQKKKKKLGVCGYIHLMPIFKGGCLSRPFRGADVTTRVAGPIRRAKEVTLG